MFERILYNSLFNFLNHNDFSSSVWIKLGDSYFNQLLPIMLGIYHFMDEGYEIRSLKFEIFWYPKNFW